MVVFRMRTALTAAFVAVALGLPVASSAQTSAAASSGSGQTLYQRLGGYDGIAAVTDDFIGRLVLDPKLKRFFGGVSDNSKARIRQLVLDQLCAATGGPCVYIGRDMKTVHKGLGIHEDDWNAAVSDLTATLAKFHVPDRDQSDLAVALTKLKPDIVEAGR
jgi:hemoglobin